MTKGNAFNVGELVCIGAGVTIKSMNDAEDETWLKTNEIGVLIHESTENVRFDGVNSNVAVVLIPILGLFCVPMAHLTKADGSKAMKDYTQFKEW